MAEGEIHPPGSTPTWKNTPKAAQSTSGLVQICWAASVAVSVPKMGVQTENPMVGRLCVPPFLLFLEFSVGGDECPHGYRK